MLQIARIPDSLYFSDWLDDTGFQKEVLMIMINGQKPVAMTAGGIVDLNMRTALEVTLQI